MGKGVKEEERIGADLGGAEPLRLRDSAPDHARVYDKEKGRYKATMRERKVKGEWKMKGQQKCTREEKINKREKKHNNSKTGF